MQITSLSFAAAAALSAFLPGQTWSVAATAPSPGTVSTSYSQASPVKTHTVTLPAGFQSTAPLDLSSSAVPSVSAELQWTPTVEGPAAPLAFTTRVATRCDTSGAPFANATATVDATLDVRLRAPLPIAGALQLTGTVGGQGVGLSWCEVRVDVGADGSEELVVWTPQGAGAGATIPVQLPTQGLVIRLTCRGQAAPVNNFPEVTVAAAFVPSEPFVQSFDETGAGTTLSFQQSPGQVAVALTTPSHTPLMLATGLQPVSVQLLPTVTQLVSLDGVYLTGALTLPLPPLPPGFAVYCQGLAVDAGGALRSSRSLRALWP